jgi:tetraacyldisaccharide 4'-kinase
MEKFLYNLATDKYKGVFFSPLKFILFLLSLIYGLAVRLSILFYRIKPAHRLKCKVISVGNITLGGTGKTSLVEFIAKYLRQNGHKVAVISRGYKRKVAASGRGASGYESMGDEPYMLSKKLGGIPVIVDSDRIRAVKRAIRDYGIDTAILDDGFQQWRIKKDLEIVAIDAGRAFGNRHLIPRGILREPLSSLKRADIFVLTKTNTSPDVKGIRYFLGKVNPGALIVESIHKPVALCGICGIGKAAQDMDLEKLKGKNAALFSGIGEPGSFEKMAKGLGFKIGLSIRFPDHYPYSEKDLKKIIAESEKNNIEAVVTTEKDAVRLEGLPIGDCPLPVMALRIELAIPKDEQVFYSRLLGLYYP